MAELLEPVVLFGLDSQRVDVEEHGEGVIPYIQSTNQLGIIQSRVKASEASSDQEKT